MKIGRSLLGVFIASASMMLAGGTAQAEPVLKLIAGNGGETPLLTSGAPKEMSILPTAVDTLPDGTILIAEATRNRVLALDDGEISVILGTGEPGPFTASGVATSVPVNQPTDILATPDGGFLVTEKGNDAIKKFLNGNVDTVATSVSNVSKIAVDPDGGFYALTATGSPNPTTSIEHFDEEYNRTLAVPNGFNFQEAPRDLIALPGGEVRYSTADGLRSANQSESGAILEGGGAAGPIDRYPNGDILYSVIASGDVTRRTNLSDPFVTVLGTTVPQMYLEEGCTDGAQASHARVRGVAIATESNDSFLIADAKHLYRLSEGIPTLAPAADFYPPSSITEGVTFQITPDRKLICGYPVNYEWDLDTDPDFEVDQGLDYQTFDASMSGEGDRHIRLRVTNTELGISSIVSKPIRVMKAPLPGLTGISINNGEQYTNDPNVTVNLRWPIGYDGYFMSNDGGFNGAFGQAVEHTVPWTLDSSGPERLPKTVYVKYGRLEWEQPANVTYTDDIILDQTAPDVPAPEIEINGFQVSAETEPEDEVSGVETIEWDFGDTGPTPLKTSQSLMKAAAPKSSSHTYAAPGTYTGKVAVSDFAGNEAVRRFEVTIAGKEPIENEEAKPPYPRLRLKINGKKVNHRKRTASIRFTSNGQQVKFTCGLSRKPTRKCRSPFVVKRLKRGKKTRIYIRATDRFGLSASASTVVKVKRR